MTIDGQTWPLGGADGNGFRLEGVSATDTSDGGQTLRVTFAAPRELPMGLRVVLIYQAPGQIPVLIKSMRIENDSSSAIRLDGIEVENFTPSANGPTSLALDDDYVRDAQTSAGKRVRSPWIEKHHIYVDQMLSPGGDSRKFCYPCPLDCWLLPGESFNSFRIFEFVLPREPEARGLAFRKATRALWPWTRDRFLSCALPPASRVEEYYEQIAQAAEVGYEGVHLHHGWIDRKLTSPLFTNYSDYELRPELFPNGWSDVRRLTDFAHGKGLAICFYTIYVNTWRGDDDAPAVDRRNDWRIEWHPDDVSSRWGNTLDPGGDWGRFVNRKIEEAMERGGFDAWHLDGPYYGDVNVAGNRGCAPGTNQHRGWRQQVEFYRRMQVHGWHGEAAQGFPAFAHGMSRITTTGYVEGDFHSLGIRELLTKNRGAAYHFTKLYRPEQATTFIPVWPWNFGSGDESRWLPLEDHVSEYNFALGFVFGYGFEGKCYQKHAYDGPRSKEVVSSWLTFWTDHAEYFKEGYVHHVQEPDGVHIDAIMHVIEDAEKPKALLVAYNPLDRAQQATLPLDHRLRAGHTRDLAVKNANVSGYRLSDGAIQVELPAYGVAWYEIDQA